MMLPGLLYAADNSDAVNERIPVTAQQMEEHWGIDCSASWASLASGGCPPAAGLPRVLQLCAAIYQRPGDPSAISCPDYAAAAAAHSDCGQLRQLIAAASTCATPTGEAAPAGTVQSQPSTPDISGN
ncbi:hypothetical protein DWB85_17400 [Seongchinamella sediminis]|uniref:Uncharacterized protein n=2 Tax=Seongchinamella sediminis TaxID=2283635 RepID=A0A3L7DS19_9GAMM|nr:hypothetical protein DWB85_17400 [Seongchinamella sediminis]